MTVQQPPQQIEYNTEVIGNTFQRIASVEPHNLCGFAKPAPLEVDGFRLERSLVRTLQRFEEALASRLAEKAVKRVLTSGRWESLGPAELICEVVTDKAIRKGSLTTVGRKDRARQIADMIRNNGRVEFAILLLPFRTATPIKNRGTLPDLGEFFTLATLRAIAKACTRSQEMVKEILNAVASKAGHDVNACVERADGRTDDNVAAIFDAAVMRCDQTEGVGKEMAVARKRLRQMKASSPYLKVNVPEAFSRLMIELARWGVPLDAWLSFSCTDIVPVRVLGCQDAGRYPCFEAVSKRQIADYRDALLDVVNALGHDPDVFDLIDYSEIKTYAIQARGSMASTTYYEARRSSLFRDIEQILPSLTRANGREAVYNEIARIDPDSVLMPLFEPILFSLEHEELTGEDWRSGRVDLLHLHTMREIYQRQGDPSREAVRRRVIARSLRGAASYCAAYEANTGSKNPAGFDDVATMFPNALRMSIHQKNESVGHFSIHVSPTGNRTPWHGTAVLSGGFSDGLVHLGIDLAALLERSGARPILASPSANGILARHASTGQPVSYLSASLEVKDQDDLLVMLDRRNLTGNG